MSKRKAYPVALGGVLLALALVLSYLEHLLPLSAAIPGVKLGLANVAALLYLRKYGLAPALLLQGLRVVIANLLFGSLAAMVYGLTGGLLAVLAMWAMLRIPRMGPVGASAVGGVVHNLGQISAAACMMGTAAVFSYLPLLILSGTACGVLTGFAVLGLEKALPN